MSADTWQQLRAMFTPESVAVMAALLTLWATAQLAFVGELADILLLGARERRRARAGRWKGRISAGQINDWYEALFDGHVASLRLQLQLVFLFYKGLSSR
jgi:hypothetical protein